MEYLTALLQGGMLLELLAAVLILLGLGRVIAHTFGARQLSTFITLAILFAGATAGLAATQPFAIVNALEKVGIQNDRLDEWAYRSAPPAPAAAMAYAQPDPEEEALRSVVSFTAPDAMARNSAYDVAAIVTPADMQAAADRFLDQFEGRQRTEDIKASPVMAATLSGAGFRIYPSGPVVRANSRETPAQWAWTVVPGKGDARRSLILEIVAVQDAQTAAAAATVLRRPIEVTVTPAQKVEDFTAWFQPLYLVWSGVFGGLWVGVGRMRSLFSRNA